MAYEDAASLKLFGSRFCRTTSIRFESGGVSSEAELRTQLGKGHRVAEATEGIGFSNAPRAAIARCLRTTPFDMLFLSLSFFVIVAAMLLVSLFVPFRCSATGGADGLLLAQGFSPLQLDEVVG